MKAEDIVRLGEDLKKDIEGMSLPHAMRYVGDHLDEGTDDVENEVIAALAIGVCIDDEERQFRILKHLASITETDIMLCVTNFWDDDLIDGAWRTQVTLSEMYDDGYWNFKWNSETELIDRIVDKIFTFNWHDRAGFQRYSSDPTYGFDVYYEVKKTGEVIKGKTFGEDCPWTPY